MSDHAPSTDNTRLRAHPSDRAISDSQTLDLTAALEQLRSEEHPAPHGHRQVTLFHHRPVSVVLFAFDAEGTLPDHVAQGTVIIQVLQGSLHVQVDATDHVVESQQIMVLNPGIPHSVFAELPSAMLLTVHLTA